MIYGIKGVICMTCPQCGNENPPKLKFCVKCGTNLDNPQEINYEQVDMGNYHSEEDHNSGGFSIGSGTPFASEQTPYIPPPTASA